MLRGQLEKQKYAATSCPRPSKPGSSSRHIPAAVKRAVRERDGDRCAFVSESGQRCSSSTRLEFDHIEPVSRGGESTVENLRLLCRAHNQYAAEREFGAEFMDQKRAEAKRPHTQKRGAGPGRARPILLSGAAASRPLPAPPFLAAREAGGLD